MSASKMKMRVMFLIKLLVSKNIVLSTNYKNYIYNNYSVDIIHDLLEGIHQNDMALITNNFIKCKYFSLDILNSRINYFNYQYSEKNKPPPIKYEHLQNGKIILSSP